MLRFISFARRSLLVAATFMIMVLAVHRATSVPAPKPNILVILTDDQGRGDYSAFGTKDIRTPHMDRLFREGMTFQNFFANSCVCSPTRAALLTGCYPDRVGVPGVIREETPDDSWGYLSPRRKAAAATAQAGRLSHGAHRQVAPRHRLAQHADRARV